MKEKTLRRGGKQTNKEIKHVLVLYNDDVNTFDHVIKTLVEVCGHDPVQAEQCALIVHLKGSCDVKSGTREVMLSMSGLLNSKGLNSRVISL
ncbi:MAG: ATP-dependent Clp protease adaptor ClpS [Bacteroidales bacterium]